MPIARFSTAAGALAVILAGCAMTPRPPAAPSTLDRLTKVGSLPGTGACFWKSNFQGDWTVLNDSTLIIHAPMAKDAYVIKLFAPVFDLGFRQALGFEDKEHTGQICNDGNDYLVVPGGQPPRMPIVAVHALSMAEQTQLLQAAGQPVPHVHGTTPPAPPAPAAPTGQAGS